MIVPPFVMLIIPLPLPNLIFPVFQFALLPLIFIVPVLFRFSAMEAVFVLSVAFSILSVPLPL